MGRRSDPHWEYVEKLDNNRFKCKFCKVVYAGGAARIKSHLSSVRGRGIKICPKVPRNVQRTVTREIEGPGSSRKRKALSSSSDDGENNTDSMSSQNQNDEVGVHVRGNEDGSPIMGVHNQEQQVEEGNHIDNYIRSSEDVEEGNHTDNYIGSSEDGSPMGVHNKEQQVEEGNYTDNNIEESVQSVKTKGIELLATKLVGEAFKRNIDEIWTWLVNDDVVSIAIYGLAGVGKTELVTHINNKLLTDPNPFHHVYWFTVQQGISLDKLQNAIAKLVGVDLSDEVDENKRSAKLLKALLRSGKSILILDNVWNDIDVAKVGIPVSENGCKLILTTRSFDVCRVIACQKTIRVECLGREEDWHLFKEILGDQTTLSDEVEEIARDVVRECEGLPLALITMARRMRGVVNIYQWRKVLNKLKGPTPMQDNMDVFEKLKLSYDHLDNSATKKCFLYCALFPQHSDIVFDREKLIEYLIVEGIIKRERNRQQEIDEGHNMLNTLENVCLLEGIDEGVKMHGWIRKMALQKQCSSVIVETDKQLKELPDEKRWTKNLRRVTVFDTLIEEIPSNLSQNCPNLSTLLFNNWILKLIPDSFFEKLSGLKVLDLSYAGVETLPGSLFNLVGLVALLLRGCQELKYVPSLANLQELEKLDLSNSGVEEVPEGMKLLSKLRYLDLEGTKLREFPAGMLPNLLRLQFLKLNVSVLLLEVELKCLRKLETLQCGLDKYGSNLKLPLLNKCNILSWRLQKTNLPIINFHIKELVMKNWGVTSLCEVYSTSTTTYVAGKIEVIQLDSLKNLRVLLNTPSTDSFSFLKEIKINKCSSIKNLFTPLLVSNLKNLEKIEVSECCQIEEIIAAAEHEIALPKLQTLCLRKLEELKSIFNRKIICDSIKYITVHNCAKLRRMPLSLVSLSERMSVSLSLTDSMQPSLPPLQIKVYPREWWESLEWDHPNAKNVLQPSVSYD